MALTNQELADMKADIRTVVTAIGDMQKYRDLRIEEDKNNAEKQALYREHVVEKLAIIEASGNAQVLAFDDYKNKCEEDRINLLSRTATLEINYATMSGRSSMLNTILIVIGSIVGAIGATIAWFIPSWTAAKVFIANFLR